MITIAIGAEKKRRAAWWSECECNVHLHVPVEPAERVRRFRCKKWTLMNVFLWINIALRFLFYIGCTNNIFIVNISGPTHK